MSITKPFTLGLTLAAAGLLSAGAQAATLGAVALPPAADAVLLASGEIESGPVQTLMRHHGLEVELARRDDDRGRHRGADDAKGAATRSADDRGRRGGGRGADDGARHEAGDDHGRRGGGRGADDGAGHDVGDDHGGLAGGNGADDGAGHDVGDDHGGRGGRDGAGHDAGDDHGGRGRGQN